MKAFLTLILAVALLVGAPAFAASSAASPLAGTWRVDVSRLPMPPEARPRSVTIGFDDAGEGKWAMQVDVVDASGARRHAEGVVPLDGSPARVDANFEADIAAAKMPAPGVLVMQLGKGGQGASTRIYAASADGTSMTEIVAYFDGEGKPILRTNYFTREK